MLALKLYPDQARIDFRYSGTPGHDAIVPPLPISATPITGVRLRRVYSMWFTYGAAARKGEQWRGSDCC